MPSVSALVDLYISICYNQLGGAAVFAVKFEMVPGGVQIRWLQVSLMFVHAERESTQLATVSGKT